MYLLHAVRYPISLSFICWFVLEYGTRLKINRAAETYVCARDYMYLLHVEDIANIHVY